MTRFLIVGVIALILFTACPPVALNTARIAYFNDQDYIHAREACLQGIETDPNNFELYTILGGSEIGLSNWDAGAEALTRAFEIDSTKTIAWIASQDGWKYYYQPFYYAARDLSDTENYEKALSYLQYAERLDPTDGRTYTLRGVIYQQQGQIDDSRMEFRKALDKDPKNPDVHFLIGKTWFDSKEYDSSAVYFGNAIEHYKTKYEKERKLIFRNLPVPDKDIEHEILTLWGKNDAKLDTLIMVKLGLEGGLQQNKRTFDSFIKAADGYSKSYYFLGMSQLNLKKYEEAYNALKMSLDIVPDDLNALFFTGEALIRLEKYDDAKGYFKRATEIKDDDLFSWFYVGVIEMQQKNYKEAIKIFEGKVLVLDEKNIEAMTNLSYCYRETGNNQKAYEYLMKADKLQKEQ
jgi:tetratricopeptide (TPR) repeat protein